MVVLVLYVCMSLIGKLVSYMEGLLYFGEGFEIKFELGSEGYGELMVIDVNIGKKLWSYWLKKLWNGGVVIIVSGFVFSGLFDGYLYVFDMVIGKVLWESL